MEEDEEDDAEYEELPESLSVQELYELSNQTPDVILSAIDEGSWGPALAWIADNGWRLGGCPIVQ